MHLDLFFCKTRLHVTDKRRKVYNLLPLSFCHQPITQTRLVHLTKSRWLKLVKIWPTNFNNDKSYFLNLTEIHLPTNINMTPTNINFTHKKYVGAVGLEKSPSPSSQAPTGWETCPAPKPLYFQWLRFVVYLVMFRSYSFGHLDSVKGITIIQT